VILGIKIRASHMLSKLSTNTSPVTDGAGNVNITI
jgi:hypothetical protein